MKSVWTAAIRQLVKNSVESERSGRGKDLTRQGDRRRESQNRMLKFGKVEKKRIFD